MALPKEILEQIQKEAEEKCWFSPTDYATNSEVIMRKQQAYIAGATAWAEKSSQWISVEERLPEPYTGCLIFYSEENRIATLYPAGWEDVKDNEITPTHWMPLPEPPKIKQDEKQRI